MDNKEKFSGKVTEYIKYRPDYPSKFINYLVDVVGVSRDSILADIGAGTGILTKQLGDKVNTIFAIEPNFHMRKACEEYCSSLTNFFAIDGSAEDTRLPDCSLDFITVAQAFHWFNRSRTKKEFQRILKTHGKVILVWNSRDSKNKVIQKNEEILRDLCPEFNGFSGGSDIFPKAFNDFFKNGHCEYTVFDNDRLLSLESFIGGNLSASYAPRINDDTYLKFVQALTDLFNRFSHQNQLHLPMKTHSYVGEI